MPFYYQLIFIAPASQAICYGLYIVSLVHAFRWVLFEDEGWVLKSSKNINWLSLITVTLIFALSTADIAIATTTILQQLYPRNLDQLLAAKVSTVASIGTQSLTFAIIDAVLIFRCWLVYEKRWRAVYIPLILWIANIACILFFFVHYSITVFVKKAFFDMAATHSLQVLYACNFATNLYATSAIVYKLWRVARGVDYQSYALYNICRIVAGTGILYTSTCLAVVVASTGMVEHYVPFFFCNGINFTMAGITFNLLLIRIGQLRAGLETDFSSKDMSGSTALSTVQPQNTSTTGAPSVLRENWH